ncbi:MAG: cation:proton antiporter [Acidimicrobiales bacterium]
MLVAAGAPGAATVLLELGGVVLLLAVLGRLAGRWSLSPIPLYLLAGLSLGDGGVLDIVTAREFIEIGAQVGLVLLLLMLGLDFTGAELTHSLSVSAPAGGVDLVANFIPGAALALVLGWGEIAAVLLGGVTYISSSGIVAKLLGDLGRTGNRETPAVLSILVIEDLVMALYLPVLAGLLAGGGPLRMAVDTVAAVAAVAVVLVVAVRFGPTLSRLVFDRSDEMLVLTILGIALLVAGIAEQLRASAAVGAFLVGIALSGPAAEGARSLLSPLRDLFAAVFFVFFGLEIDPASILPIFGLAAGLAVVGVVTKVFTGWWSAARAGVARPGRMRAGTALVARGEFSIVIAGLGVAAGLESDLGALAASYVLILAVAGPILTRFSDAIAQLLPGRPSEPEDSRAWWRQV